MDPNKNGKSGKNSRKRQHGRRRPQLLNRAADESNNQERNPPPSRQANNAVPNIPPYWTARPRRAARGRSLRNQGQCQNRGNVEERGTNTDRPDSLTPTTPRDRPIAEPLNGPRGNDSSPLPVNTPRGNYPNQFPFGYPRTNPNAWQNQMQNGWPVLPFNPPRPLQIGNYHSILPFGPPGAGSHLGRTQRRYPQLLYETVNANQTVEQALGRNLWPHVEPNFEHVRRENNRPLSTQAPAELPFNPLGPRTRRSLEQTQSLNYGTVDERQILETQTIVRQMQRGWYAQRGPNTLPTLRPFQGGNYIPLLPIAIHGHDIEARPTLNGNYNHRLPFESPASERTGRQNPSRIYDPLAPLNIPETEAPRQQIPPENYVPLLQLTRRNPTMNGVETNAAGNSTHERANTSVQENPTRDENSTSTQNNDRRLPMDSAILAANMNLRLFTHPSRIETIVRDMTNEHGNPFQIPTHNSIIRAQANRGRNENASMPGNNNRNLNADSQDGRYWMMKDQLLQQRRMPTYTDQSHFNQIPLAEPDTESVERDNYAAQLLESHDRLDKALEKLIETLKLRIRDIDEQQAKAEARISDTSEDSDDPDSPKKD